MEKEVKKGKFEKRFYEVLENIFLGKDIKSSSSPLIETKSKYYKQFRSDLQKYINDKSNVDCHENSCEFSRNDGAEEVNKTSCSNSEKVDSSNKAKKTRLNTEEIYEKLYDFSKSYFSQSGSVLYENTPKNSNIYADVFKKGFESDLKHLNESSEVSLFYKTKGLLYTKSEKVYKDISISVESYTFNFKVSSGSKNTNAKQYPHFTNANSSLLDTQEINKDSKDSKDSNEAQAQESTQTNLLNNQIDLKVTLENKEFSDSKVKELAKELALNSEILKEAIKKYRRTINIDFFINPSAESFLKEQLDLYLYKYFKNQALTQERINELAIIKDIALKLISYISKFESELARIYLKPKFAKSVNYLVSLESLKNVGFDIKRLESSSGYKEQVKAWEALNINPKDSNALFAENNAPIDTRFFSELKIEIKECIKPQGTLIKSENYQALNSIKNAYKGKVKLIYIDPPYNTGNDDFIYVDKYNHSCWLSMMASRLEVARELLRDDGVIFIQCDDNEQAYLKVLCDEIYGRENFVATICWEKKYSPANDAKWLSDNHDFILIYARNKQIWKPNLLERTKEMNARYVNIDNDRRGAWKSGGFSVKTYTEKYDYPITTPSGKIVYPPSGSCWQTSQENYEKLKADNRIWFGKNGDSKPQLKQFLSEVQQGVVVKTFWKYDEVGHNQIAKQELKALFAENRRGGGELFSTPKPEALLKRIIEISTNPGDLVLDFFAGSGTTCAVAHKMGREYIGIEMGEHFNSVILPRILKVINGEQGGVSKACNFSGGGVVEYYELESYEDTLQRAEFAEIPSDFVKSYEEAWRVENPFMLDSKLSCALKISGDTYTLDLENIYKDIDSIKSLENYYGKKVLKIENNEVIFEGGVKLNLLEAFKCFLIW
ncbi:MAG: site-specific DNA-methyltransferase [Helicobacteraceae bacterium]|nr:site-specific DNA-methyltransferase [Helicobacteraceae bacterium]